MSLAALSRISWSYARSLMRMRGAAIPSLPLSLLDDGRDRAGAHRPATLSDGEPEAFLHRDRRTQLDRHLGVVARHDHLGALSQLDRPGDVRGAEVELRAVAVEERGVPPALVLRQ